MQKIYDDGILEATLYPDRWVFCRWIDNKHGRLQKRLIRDLKMIEQVILRDKLMGWFTLSELCHKEFHKLLTKFGCEAAQVDGPYQYFIKRMVV
jgi:hypothetical protein